jgi:hypothetical protein
MKIRQFLHIPSDYHGAVKISELFKDGRQKVFIGINGSHWYLQVGEKRVDGKAFFAAAETRERKFTFKNLMFVFDDLTPEQIAGLEREVAQGKTIRSFNCLEGACKLLERGAGIQVRDAGSINPLITPLVRNILKKGFVDQKGNPVPYRIYTPSSDLSANTALSVAKTDDIVLFAIWVVGHTIAIEIGKMALGQTPIAAPSPSPSPIRR